MVKYRRVGQVDPPQGFEVKDPDVPLWQVIVSMGNGVWDQMNGGRLNVGEHCQVHGPEMVLKLTLNGALNIETTWNVLDDLGKLYAVLVGVQVLRFVHHGGFDCDGRKIHFERVNLLRKEIRVWWKVWTSPWSGVDDSYIVKTKMRWKDVFTTLEARIQEKNIWNKFRITEIGLDLDVMETNEGREDLRLYFRKDRTKFQERWRDKHCYYLEMLNSCLVRDYCLDQNGMFRVD